MLIAPFPMKKMPRPSKMKLNSVNCPKNIDPPITSPMPMIIAPQIMSCMMHLAYVFALLRAPIVPDDVSGGRDVPHAFKNCHTGKN